MKPISPCEAFACSYRLQTRIARCPVDRRVWLLQGWQREATAVDNANEGLQEVRGWNALAIGGVRDRHIIGRVVDDARMRAQYIASVAQEALLTERELGQSFSPARAGNRRHPVEAFPAQQPVVEQR